ncbi:MAG: hypothetical protein QXF35_03720 [Candidatus Bilamarchaeaceae archaeon]
MIPESKLIKSEILLRELALPEEVLLARKSIVRWLALSLGLINPNESRTIIIDLLDTLLYFHFAGKKPTTKDIIDKMMKSGATEKNIKAIYYHLERLKENGIINRKKGEYFFGDESTQNLAEIFKKIYEKRSSEIFKNIERVCARLARE